MKKAVLCVSFLLLAASLAHSQLVSFKLMGGMTWINGDDYNRGIDGLNSYLKSVSSVQGGYKKIVRGPDLEGEILVYWGSRAAVGFGGGYSDLSNKSRAVYSDPATLDITDSTYEPHLSAIPFYLNIHFMPKSDRESSRPLRRSGFSGRPVQIRQPFVHDLSHDEADRIVFLEHDGARRPGRARRKREDLGGISSSSRVAIVTAGPRRSPETGPSSEIILRVTSPAAAIVFFLGV